MKFTITTCNNFYNGWVAWILGIELPEESCLAFQEGWKMGKETNSLMVNALHAEIKKGKITVKTDKR